MDQEVARIAATYSQRVAGVDDGEFEAAIWAEFARRADATIQDYVPVFVERSVRVRYGIGSTASF